VIVLAALGGCYSGPTLGVDGAGNGSPATTDVSATDPTTTQGAQIAADLPCDVANALRGACSSCHGTTLAEGARVHLLSRADLAAPLATDPARTVADLCLIRMQSEKDPMPPAVAAEPGAVGVLEAWITAGLPAGKCSAAGIDYTTESVCTSKKKWTHGSDEGDENMNPGQTCIACHKQEAAEGEIHAKIFSVAGTLYPSAHEPDDCNGLDGVKKKATVIVTDATGKTFTLDVNEAGNFMSEAKMKKPLRAKVRRGDAVYEMQDDIKDGDCNACHTEAGRADEGAEYPRGRIVLP
jgi:hypothetical protein